MTEDEEDIRDCEEAERLNRDHGKEVFIVKYDEDLLRKLEELDDGTPDVVCEEDDDL